MTSTHLTPTPSAYLPPGILLNDEFDPSCPANEVTVRALTQPQFGSVTLLPNGAFDYKVGQIDPLA